METVEVISAKNILFLHIDGYLYYKHSGKSRRYWNCRNKEECSVRAITTGDGKTLVERTKKCPLAKLSIGKRGLGKLNPYRFNEHSKNTL